jgi:1,4-dihydroxy-2-naphthoate octaprenyltransferase
LGFLGITADVTGFTFDPPILIFALVTASLIQIMSNEANKDKIRSENKSKANNERNKEI